MPLSHSDSEAVGFVDIIVIGKLVQDEVCLFSRGRLRILLVGMIQSKAVYKTNGIEMAGGLKDHSETRVNTSHHCCALSLPRICWRRMPNFVSKLSFLQASVSVTASKLLVVLKCCCKETHCRVELVQTGEIWC